MKRSKAPQDHTTHTEAPLETGFHAIGVVRSPYKERFGTPRQPTVTTQVLGDAALDAEILLYAGCDYEMALEGIEEFDYIWVISWLHLNTGWKPKVIPPRGPKVSRGVFATRAPHRPNSIGLSALRLMGVEGRVLKVRGIDLLDGTPVLDIKPYVPYADAFPGAHAGWLDTIGEAAHGPDRFEDVSTDSQSRL